MQRFRNSDETARDTAQLIADTSGTLYASMHDLIPRLRPLALDNVGLGDALEEQVAEWRRQYPDIDFILTIGAMPADLGESYMLAACRIVQEAVVNALRHSHSKRIEISSHAEAKEIRLEIRDYGSGLPADWQRPGHFGIRGMCERARILGGDVRVDNVADGGVRVQATLPLQ